MNATIIRFVSARSDSNCDAWERRPLESVELARLTQKTIS
jgi:hypothetical protein